MGHPQGVIRSDVSVIIWVIALTTYMQYLCLSDSRIVLMANTILYPPDDAEGLLLEFKAWFEDDAVRKVWHNYSFDRAVMANEGIVRSLCLLSLILLPYCHSSNYQQYFSGCNYYCYSVIANRGA